MSILGGDENSERSVTMGLALPRVENGGMRKDN
jgi:hypothetical protein